MSSVVLPFQVPGHRDAPRDIPWLGARLCLPGVPLAAALPSSTLIPQLQLREGCVLDKDRALTRTLPIPGTAASREGTP